MSIFVGREPKERGTRATICDWIEASGHEPVSWDELGLFSPGLYFSPELICANKTVDNAVFIYAGDDAVHDTEQADESAL